MWEPNHFESSTSLFYANNNTKRIPDYKGLTNGILITEAFSVPTYKLNFIILFKEKIKQNSYFRSLKQLNIIHKWRVKDNIKPDVK
jgi:hypothetical protein